MMHSSWRLIMGIYAILLLLTSCKFGDAAKSKAIQPGRLIGERSQDPFKAQVLIHYANNPVNTAVYLAERDFVLKSFDGASMALPQRRAIIEGAKGRVASDLDKFNDALAIDLADIKLSICRGNAAISAGVVFINNASLVNRRIQVCYPGESPTLVPDTIANKVFSVYDRIKTNKIFEHSPLSHLDMLRASLDMVTEIFPSAKHEYSLVIKSHGNEELTITPKVAFDSQLVTSKFLARYFATRPETRSVAQLDKAGLDKNGLDKDGLDKQGLDKDGLDKDGLDKDGLDKDGLDKDGLDKDGLDKDGLAGADPIHEHDIRAAGISKEQMLRAIMDPSRNMFFNVLFLESCNSDLGALMQDLADTPTPNIGYLFTSDHKGLSYSTVDYQRAKKSASGSLRAWLATELNRAAALAK
jgi:pentapeptide MXKDX repeat protein